VPKATPNDRQRLLVMALQPGALRDALLSAGILWTGAAFVMLVGAASLNFIPPAPQAATPAAPVVTTPAQPPPMPTATATPAAAAVARPAPRGAVFPQDSTLAYMLSHYDGTREQASAIATRRQYEADRDAWAQREHQIERYLRRSVGQ
jgi:hypothetical protein